jgi:4-coumarate--CoA ligase
MKTVGSIGCLLSNQTSKIMLPSGQEASAGENGELWVKGPNVFKGYLNNIEGTKSAFSADGYLMTGDIGYQDENGNVYITDRIKELIKYNGFQIAPAEIEGVLMSHPLVSDAAVIGIMDEEKATEVPLAFVVAAARVDRDDATAHEIMKWTEDKLAPHKRLRGGIVFVKEIPKSAAGKILRNILRARAKGASTRSYESKL